MSIQASQRLGPVVAALPSMLVFVVCAGKAFAAPCPDDRPIIAEGVCSSRLDAFVSCIRRTAAESTSLSAAEKKELAGKAQVEVNRLVKVNVNAEGVHKVEKNLVATYSRAGHAGAEILIAKECERLAILNNPHAHSSTKKPASDFNPATSEPAPTKRPASELNLAVSLPATSEERTRTAPSVDKTARPNDADVWKSAAAYSASPAAKSIAEADRILREADVQVVRVYNRIGQQFAPTFGPSQTGWQMDAPKQRLEDWRALTKPGHQQPALWNKYEYRIVNGDLVFTELGDGKVFYRTRVDAPDFGDKFATAVQATMAPQLKAEMNRGD